MADARRLVDKLWSYCNVLRDDGVALVGGPVEPAVRAKVLPDDARRARPGSPGSTSRPARPGPAPVNTSTHTGTHFERLGEQPRSATSGPPARAPWAS